MWTIGNFHLEIVSRPDPLFSLHKTKFLRQVRDAENGATGSRIALKIYVHVPANIAYTVVKFYANPRLQKRNCFLTVGSDPDRFPLIKPLRSSVWHEI